MKHTNDTPDRSSIFSTDIHLILLLSICPVLLLILSSGCSQNNKESSEKAVTVTLPPEAWLTQQIAGNRMKVNTLLPTGANPETYDPTVGDIRRLTTSDLLLVSGTLQFEDKVASQLRGETEVYDLSKGLELLYDTHGHRHDDDHHGERSGSSESDHHHHESGADPHVWSSVKNARIIADNILTALIAADPEGKEYYEANAARLYGRLDSLSAEYGRRLGPLKGRSFLVWHPSLSYLARDYGLNQQFLEMENKEQSVKSFKTLMDSLKNSRPLVMFVQPEYDTPTSAAMAREFDLPSVTINPLNPDWMEEMDKVVNTLAPRN